MSTMDTKAVYLAICVITYINRILILGQNMELTYIIAEERPAMTQVGNVLEDSNIRDLVSPDDISDLRFSFLTEGNPQASYLWINSTSGELKTSVRINRESTCQRLALCELRVQTVVQAQLGAFFMIIQVKVTIKDVNDNAPTFTPSTFTVKISEGENPGVSFPLPTAADPDMGSGNAIVGYSLISTSSPFSLTVDGSGSAFDIRILLDASLDRETTPSYQLFVLAVDGGSPRLTGTLTVKVEVTDVNDNSPVFEKPRYMANISDSMAVNSVVVVVKATDKDDGENGLIKYVMAPGQEDPVVFVMFFVNESSGEVRSKVSLDSYAGRSYRLTIEAQDSAPTSKTSRTDVIISVVDTHNSQPEILLNVFGVAGQAKVSEMAELGRVVAHVAVSDPDSSLSPNGQISCSLNNSEHFQLQAMVVKQFKIILIKRLDRELKTFHSVNVICEDSGSPTLSASSSFIVEVDDENDNSPIFDSLHYTADFTEAQTGDRDGSDIVMTVRATDRDTGLNAHLTYRLAEGSDSDFGIYRDGAIVVTKPTGIDREDRVKGAVRKLTVLAVDSGKLPLTGTTTVVITIRDINDNPPKFSEPMYFLNVPENAPVDFIVGSVNATDADSESNAIFYFEMHKRDLNSVPFHVSRSGVIKVTGNVDRESKANYDFRVVAYDLGEPTRLSSTVTVQIKVTDRNDNSPEFVFPNDDNYTIYVPHTLSENTAFANIIAIDRDEGRNGELVFARDSGNGSKFFDIEASSGQVVLVRPLSVKEIGLHIIVVVAHDRGVELQMATQSMMHIVVYEGNATLPLQNDGMAFRNIIVVIALIVVTAILALAILLTILLIRRVDKQRRLYNAKAEEAKADSNLRHLNPCSPVELESPAGLSDIIDDARDGGKKKKEVSFSLEEDNKSNITQTMTTFNPVVMDKYDPISDKDRGKLKDDSLSSNHYQADRQTKSSGVKKDIHNFNYHLVHHAGPNGHKHKQPTDPAHQQDDTGSDISGDSTSDSGRGGSDVELQSHGGVSKDSGDTSFASQRGFDTHNNLSASNSGNHNNNIPSNVKLPGAKSVHFQNIRSDHSGYGQMVSQHPPTTFTPRSPRSPILPGLPSHKNGSIFPRYTPNVISEEEGSFVNLPNNNNNGRCSNPSSKELEFHRNKIMSDNYVAKPYNLHMGSVRPTQEYAGVARMRSPISQKSNSNSCLDGAEAWDGDTTTSGSYTVDPHELCDEIDKLFFEDFQDVVV